MKLLTLILLTILTMPMMLSATEQATEKRINEVVERGRHVMPFDLDKTIHIFNKVSDGGIQQVIVKNKTNKAQIKLIREHLFTISQQFKRRDFSGPIKIHGKNMSGLDVMRSAKPSAIKISYKELQNGAQIEYYSQQPGIINAIHQFFDAQLRDHARHAISRHSMHHAMHRVPKSSAVKDNEIEKNSTSIHKPVIQDGYKLKTGKKLVTPTKSIQ
ncbi:MAG: aspartate carbamoyltransferase [Methylococcales bacterium]